ncbi:hypothetical protein [Neorhizobium sp. P12A]|uniref:hypothetical protein n=1 Tax=Neorhizobium sp. P12A TaxID=2268027 RepID=UPI0011EBFDE6|nr:hypothetical protein [Neorhizobium sp. P12A]
MTSPLLHRAVLNNALWCDAVCAAQGSAGEFSPTLWQISEGTPPFYPNAITLTGEATASEQETAIAGLTRLRPGGWGVKDSYCAIDLSPQEFEILFEAEWIGLEANTPFKSSHDDLTWRRITTTTELDAWETAWAGGERHERTIFAERLLRDPAIVILAAYANGDLSGGGILNHQGGVVGHSNLFAIGNKEDLVRGGLIREARRLFPGQPVVGYERSNDLASALALGFTALGPLRVWVRG